MKYLIKIKYIIYKLLYNIFINKYIKLLLIYCNNIIEFVNLVIPILKLDIYLLKIFFIKIKKIYFKLKVWKHLFIIFFFILGVIPFFIFIIFLFFFFKYMLKYIFLFFDYFVFYNENHKYFQNFFKFKYYVLYFFDFVPRILKETFNYIFRNKWKAYFASIIIAFLKRKKIKYLGIFYKQTDYFLLVYVPKKYIELSNKIHDDFILWILYYIKLKKKIRFKWIRFKLKFIKYKVKIVKYNKYKYRFRLKLRLKLKIRRNVHYKYYYYKYKHNLFYLIWWRKFLFSEAFRVTIYAFFEVSLLNIKACFLYTFFFIKLNIAYVFINIIYIILRFIFSLSWNIKIYNKEFENLLFNKKQKLIKHIINLIINILYTILVYKIPVIYRSTYTWYNISEEMYYMIWSFKSLTYWNLKFYSIVVKFFKRLHPLCINLLKYDKKFLKLIYSFKIWYFCCKLKLKIIDIYYYIIIVIFDFYINFLLFLYKLILLYLC